MVVELVNFSGKFVDCFYDSEVRVGFGGLAVNCGDFQREKKARVHLEWNIITVALEFVQFKM